LNAAFSVADSWWRHRRTHHTGAGGGGCVIGIGDESAISQALKEFSAFVVEPEMEGARIEED
jgi:mevalonate kinase